MGHSFQPTVYFVHASMGENWAEGGGVPILGKMRSETVRDGEEVGGSRGGDCERKHGCSVMLGPARTPETPPAFLSCLLGFFLLAALCLCCSTWAFSSCGTRGLLSSFGTPAPGCTRLVALQHVGS